MFDDGRMMSRAEFESTRRSLAMAPTSRDLMDRIVQSHDELLRERERIVALLADLPESWSSVRSTLNELSKSVGIDVTANHPARGGPPIRLSRDQ
jgi:hypothetical protein